MIYWEQLRPIDPSIPLGVQTQPQNGLQQTLGTANSMIGLQSNMQKLRANQVISNAYTQATDPQTGQTDFGKLQALATQGGAGAFLPDFMGKISEQRNQNLAYQSGKLQLAIGQQADIRNRIGSLMASPQYGKGDMTNDIVNAMAGAVAAGTMPVAQAAEQAQQIPSDPQGQAEWIKQHFLTSLSGEAKLHALLPQMQTVNTGGSTNVLAINPMTGQPTVTGSMQNTLSPEAATTPVQLTSPTGTPYTTTRGQFAAQAGGGGGAAPGAGGYTGRMNPAAGGAAPTDIPAGGVQSGLSPADVTAQTAQAQQAVTAAQSLHNAAADAPMRINLLDTARDALAGITTGPGTDWRNTFGSALNSFPAVGSALKAMGVTDPASIQNYDEYKKILTNYASSVSGSLGTGTDARLNAAVTGNANPGISNMANEDILTKTLAAEKMRQAQDFAFQNSGVSPAKFNQWQSQWNKNVDPQAFVFTEMNPTQQAAFIARETKAGTLPTFKKSLGNLVRAGIITMPQPAAPAATAAPAAAAPTDASGVPQ